MRILLAVTALLIPSFTFAQTLTSADALKDIKEMSVAVSLSGEASFQATALESQMKTRLEQAGIKVLPAGFPKLALRVYLERVFSSFNSGAVGLVGLVELDLTQLFPKTIEGKAGDYRASIWSSSRLRTGALNPMDLVDEFVQDYKRPVSFLATPITLVMPKSWL